MQKNPTQHKNDKKKSRSFSLFKPRDRQPNYILSVLCTTVALLLVVIAVLAVLISWLLRSAAKGDVSRSKLFLHQKEELREQQDMQVLVGHEGRTLSVLRPSGIGDFDGVRLNVVTEGEFIENGVAIRIARVEGGKIVVKAIKS